MRCRSTATRCQRKRGALVGFDGHKRVKGTKVHAAVTEGSLPVAVAVSSARIHEGTRLIPLMESISIETGHRPRKRPKVVYADTKYATPLNRFHLDKKHVGSQIPDPSNKRRRPGRPRFLDKETYHGVRYNVERFVGWLENYRKITVRYERMPQTFLGLIHLACIRILWRVEIGSLSVKVMYFQMPQTISTKEEHFVLQSPSHFRDLLSGVLQKHPSLSPMMPSMMVLIDGVRAQPDATLRDGDEVDFIPAVAGG